MLARPVVVAERVRGTVSTLSVNCTKDDRRTAEACAEIAELREELAVANEGAKLETSAAALRQQIGDLLLSSAGMPIHVAGSLRRDAWGGRQRIELQIDDAADPRQQG